MQLTFLGNRYQSSDVPTELMPMEQKGMYRGTHYTYYAPAHTAAQPTQNIHLRYRGVQYDR